MKTSQAGIDLIKEFEGYELDAYVCSAGKLVGHAAPFLPVPDEPCHSGVYSGDKRHSVRRHTHSHNFSHGYNLLTSELRRWVLFSAQVNKPGLPLVFGISGERNPLKVFRSVVGLIPVDVINRKPLLVSANKRQRDEAMNLFLGSFPVNHWGHAKIASVIHNLRKGLFWVLRKVPLPNTVPHSKSLGACVSGYRYAPVSVNKPVNTFCRYFHRVFHGVPLLFRASIIAGHMTSRVAL